MHKIPKKSDFEDSRGIISDLILEEIHGVTHITFEQGAVRGNHVHKETTQWKYILCGSLTLATLDSIGNVVEIKGEKGDLFVSKPGEPHAMKALEYSEMLVFTRGPRLGENYDTDTFKVKIL